MAEANDKYALLLQNLHDAGCSEEKIQKCLDLAVKKNLSEMQRLLTAHRRELLQAVRLKQKEIDCLDYLLFQLEHQEEEII